MAFFVLQYRLVNVVFGFFSKAVEISDFFVFDSFFEFRDCFYLQLPVKLPGFAGAKPFELDKLVCTVTSFFFSVFPIV